MKFFLLLFFFISCSISTFAQYTTHKLITGGYTYQNLSFGEFGGKLLFLNKDEVLYRVGASGLIGNTQNKWIVLPKIQGDVLFNFQKNRNIKQSFYYLIGAEATTKYASPKIGLSLFGIVDFVGGYAFSIDKSGVNGKELKGINFNFSLNIPLVAIQDLAR